MDIAPVSYPEILPSEPCDCIVSTVKWFRDFRDNQGIIATITAIAIGLLVMLVLALSLVGLPLVIALGNECDRQKAQTVFKQNMTIPMVHFLHDNHDIFDKFYPWLTYQDRQQLALTSRSFYSLIDTNAILNQQENWFVRAGFKTVDAEKSMGQHINAYKYLNQTWHFSPEMIEILSGIMYVYELPIARKRTIETFSSWPFPSKSVIKVIDVQTKESYIAFRFNWYVRHETSECIEFYRFDKGKKIYGLLAAKEGDILATGVNWVEVPSELFLERLVRVIRKERVGHIAPMVVQVMEMLRSIQQGTPLSATREVIPFNSRDLPLESELFDLQLFQ